MGEARSDRSGSWPPRSPAAISIAVIAGLSLALRHVLFVIWATGGAVAWYRYVAGLQGVPPFVAALLAARRIVYIAAQIHPLTPPVFAGDHDRTDSPPTIP